MNDMLTTSDESVVTASAWIKGISLSVLASIIGGASKLAIRKSWLLEQQQSHPVRHATEPPLFQDNVQPTTSTETLYNNNNNNDIGDDDYYDGVNVRYSQITNDGEIDTVRQNPSHDDALPDDHHDHHRYFGSSNRRVIPILLRTGGMIGMTALNPLCSVLAMNYASPSILAPFSGLTLVWIVLFSDVLVGERPSLQQIMAATFIVLGEVVIAIFGDHTNDVGVSVADVIHSYRDTGFLLFIVAMCVWMTWLLYSMSTTRASPTVRQFAWGVAGGSITGFQNFLKDALTVLKASATDDNNFPYLLFIGMIVLAIATALAGLMILTLCMKRYDVTYSASMFVGSFCITASIMSAIHYNTFSHLNGAINVIGYPTGLLILLYGVYLLLVSTTTATNSSNETDSRTNTVSMIIVEAPQHNEDGDLS